MQETYTNIVKNLFSSDDELVDEAIYSLEDLETSELCPILADLFKYPRQYASSENALWRGINGAVILCDSVLREKTTPNECIEGLLSAIEHLFVNALPEVPVDSNNNYKDFFHSLVVKKWPSRSEHKRLTKMALSDSSYTIYMFWDLLCVPWRTKKHLHAHVDRLLEVLEKILYLRNSIFALSAIHGLNHIEDKKKVPILNGFIKTTTDKNLAELAELAIEGRLQ